MPAGVTPVAVASGDENSMVLTGDGHVYTWGGNCNGQFGNGTHFCGASPDPVEVSLPAGRGRNRVGRR